VIKLIPAMGSYFARLVPLGWRCCPVDTTLGLGAFVLRE